MDAIYQALKIGSKVAFRQIETGLDDMIDVPFDKYKIFLAGNRHIVPMPPGSADLINRVDLGALYAETGKKLGDRLRMIDVGAREYNNDPETEAVTLQRSYSPDGPPVRYPAAEQRSCCIVHAVRAVYAYSDINVVLNKKTRDLVSDQRTVALGAYASGSTSLMGFFFNVFDKICE